MILYVDFTAGDGLNNRSDFAVGTKREHLDIYTMNADGSGLRAFGLKGLNAGPIWSPDGRRIFWVS